MSGSPSMRITGPSSSLQKRSRDTATASTNSRTNKYRPVFSGRNYQKAREDHIINRIASGQEIVLESSQGDGSEEIQIYDEKNHISQGSDSQEQKSLDLEMPSIKNYNYKIPMPGFKKQLTRKKKARPSTSPIRAPGMLEDPNEKIRSQIADQKTYQQFLDFVEVSALYRLTPLEPS